MKTILTLIALLSASIGFGQEVITSSLTDEHQQVKGSKLFLIPPESFAVATQFQGFQDFDRSASLLVAIIETPAESIINAFTEEALKGQGVKMLQRAEITLNGMPGLFITGEQKGFGTTFNKYILVFGDENFTALVNGMYPKEDAKELDKLVIDAMRSTVYVDDADNNPLDALNFTIDTEGTKMQYGSMFSGSVLFSVDGKVPPQSEDKTNFTISQSVNPSFYLDEKSFCIQRLKKLPYQDITFREEEIEEVTIDSLHGYTIIAQAVEPNDNDNEARYIYQTMLFHGEGHYFILLGTSRDEPESNQAMFEQIVKSFKRREE